MLHLRWLKGLCAGVSQISRAEVASTKVRHGGGDAKCIAFVCMVSAVDQNTPFRPSARLVGSRRKPPVSLDTYLRAWALDLNCRRRICGIEVRTAVVQRSSIRFKIPVTWASDPACIEAKRVQAAIIAGAVTVVIIVVVMDLLTAHGSPARVPCEPSQAFDRRRPCDGPAGASAAAIVITRQRGFVTS